MRWGQPTELRMWREIPLSKAGVALCGQEMGTDSAGVSDYVYFIIMSVLTVQMTARPFFKEDVGK